MSSHALFAMRNQVEHGGPKEESANNCANRRERQNRDCEQRTATTPGKKLVAKADRD